MSANLALWSRRAMVWRCAGCALVLLMLRHTMPTACAAQPDKAVQRFVHMHQESVALIHQFDVELEASHELLLYPDEPPGKRIDGVWRWSRQGDLERIRNRDLFDNPNSHKVETLWADLFRDGTEERALYDWNPDAPPKLEPTNQHGVRGFVAPQTGLLPARIGDPGPMLLFLFKSSDTSDPRQSLDQLVASSLACEQLPADPRNDTPRLIGLRIWTSEPVGQPDKANHIDIFLDPQAGMLARKCVEHYPQFDWALPTGEKEKVSVQWVREVKEVRDCGDGVFFPMRSELRIHRADRVEPTAIFWCNASRLVVNKELPADALDFRFPSNLIVEFPPRDGELVLKLWGRDDTPIRDISKTADIIAAQREFANHHVSELERSGSKSSLWAAILAVNAAVVVLLIGIVAYRRYWSENSRASRG